MTELKPLSGRERHDDLKKVGSTAGYVKEIKETGDNAPTIKKVVKDPKKSAYLNRLCLKTPTEWSNTTANLDNKYNLWGPLYGYQEERLEALMPYLNDYNFYDDVSCLPPHDNLHYFNPITFIEHLMRRGPT